MGRPWHPWRAMRRRWAAWRYAAQGRVALLRGDQAAAVAAWERAVACRPGAFGPLVRLARGYLRTGDLWRAHRTLAQAREASPARFHRQVPAWLARSGLDAEVLRRVLTGDADRVARGVCVSAALPRRACGQRPVPSACLPYGDCRDLDEYAHFRAMPPITRAECELIDWPALLEDLLED